MRSTAWTMAVVCTAALGARPDPEPSAPWTFLFVVAAHTPGATQTRRGLDAVARHAHELAQRLPSHNFVILHSPSDSTAPRLTVVKQGRATRQPIDTTTGQGLPALLGALESCPARRRALLYVGHSDSEVGPAPTTGETRMRLGMPFALEAIAAWVERGSGPAFDLVVLHCCESARIETILPMSPYARCLVASEARIQPQSLDYRALAAAGPHDTGRDLAGKLLTAAARADAQRADVPFVIVTLDEPRLKTFLAEFNAFARAVHAAIGSGGLDAREFGDLYEPVGRGAHTPGARQPGRANLLDLLAYAGRAHWVPRAARTPALSARAALAPLVEPCPGPGRGEGREGLVTVCFPWRATRPAAGLRLYGQARFAQDCAWPRLVAMAHRLARTDPSPFLGWDLERALLRTHTR